MATSPLTLQLQLQQSLSFSHSLIPKLFALSNYGYESFSSITTINFNPRKQPSIQCSSRNPPLDTTSKNSVRRFSKKTSSPSSSSSSSHTDKKVSFESKSVNSTSYTVVEKKKKNENENKNAFEKKKKIKVNPQQAKLRVSLDMCSRRGDLKGALSLFDSAISQGVKLGQHQYTVLLYLCSSAAIGYLRPAKSGSGTRTLNALVSSNNLNGSVDRNDDDDERFCSDSDDNKLLDSSVSVSHSDDSDMSDKDKRNGIMVSEDVKKYALQRGFEVYENMCLNKVEMNEAALTSVARMAMAMSDGDKAFERVKQMKILGINPKLRSYGPALSTYCNNGEIDKAFDVEKHMLEHGVYPEEPELEALLRASIRAGKSDRVYYVLHKLRSSVRKISTTTADLIVDWFKNKTALKMGKRKWDKGLIMEAMQNNGGGWHGTGWLGKGKWQVLQTSVGKDGVCKCCGMQLATIDLDPVETENFAKSVASIAISNEKNSNFQTFQVRNFNNACYFWRNDFSYDEI